MIYSKKLDSIKGVDTVGYDAECDALVMLDQTRLPGEAVLIALRDLGEIIEAIKSLRVRGAPAIGVGAAIGLYVAASGFGTDDRGEFNRRLGEAKAALAASRPTAVNLSWALARMCAALDGYADAHVDRALGLLRREALRIRDEDVEICRAIGENGLALLHDGCTLLTHCNAGALAAVRYGTALAPIHLGRERGMRFRVFADETRPLLQGARLSALELSADGVETTVICDNMASQVMKSGAVDAVLVGADRIAANGDAANKIGTSGVAILAAHYGVPFYVCAPTSTVDLSLAHGGLIPIEQRAPSEVTELWYERRMAPDGVGVFNPAFDVTDASLITGIVTEFGVARAPYGESLRAMCAEAKKRGR